MLHSLITTQAAHGRRLDTLMGDMADLRIIQLHHLRSPLSFAQPPGLDPQIEFALTINAVIGVDGLGGVLFFLERDFFFFFFFFWFGGSICKAI